MHELSSKDPNNKTSGFEISTFFGYCGEIIIAQLLLEHSRALSGVIVPFCAMCLLLYSVFGHSQSIDR